MLYHNVFNPSETECEYSNGGPSVDPDLWAKQRAVYAGRVCIMAPDRQGVNTAIQLSLCVCIVKLECL